MRSISFSVAAATAVGLVVASAPLAAPPPAGAAIGFDEARTIASANEATPEWEAYAGPFFAQLGPVLSRTMRLCFPRNAERTLDEFTILFTIEADGSLANFLHRPKAAAVSCVVDGIRSVRVPSPPHPGWWEALEMKLTP